MNPFEQKSIFLWNIPQVAGGDPQKIADTLKAGRFSSVWVKAADGAGVFYSGWQTPQLVQGIIRSIALVVPTPDDFPDRFAGEIKLPGFMQSLFYSPNVTKAFVDTMHANNIAVIGWGFCYGMGDSEGRIAAQQVDALGLDGWVFDVESKFESHIDCVARAGQMLGTFKKTVIKKVPMGWCSWAFHWSRGTGAQIHNPQLTTFGMSLCNYGIPMIYWNRLGADGKPSVMSDVDVMGDLSTSTKQWRDITDKPLIPAGRAYTGDGNVVIPSNVAAFGQAAYTSGLDGVTWWSLEHALRLPDIWAALVQTPAFKPLPPPPAPDPQPVAPIVNNVKDKATGQLVPLQLTGNVDVAGVTYVWATDQRPVAPPPPVTPSPPSSLYRFDVSSMAKMQSWGWAPPVNFLFYRLYERKPAGGMVRMATIALPIMWRAWLVSLQMLSGTDAATAEKVVQWAERADAGPMQGGIGKWIVADTPSGNDFRNDFLTVTGVITANDGKRYAAIDYIDATKAPPAIASLSARHVTHLLYQLDMTGNLTHPSGLAALWVQPIISKVQPYVLLSDLVKV